MVLRGEDDLTYTVDVYDRRGNHERVLARVADLMTGLAAYGAAVRRHPGDRIVLRHKARVIEDSEKISKGSANSG